MSWTTFRLQVMTPLFSGDDPSPGNVDSPIRIPSIRGGLRFWFRAVAAGHGIVDRKALWEAEEKVFGSTKHPSLMQLRLDRNLAASGVGTKPGWAGGPNWGNRFHGAHYLLGQGLWHYRSGLTRPFVPPSDFTVDLRVRFNGDDAVSRQFLLAMWAWLTYGGLGARTRRGFGQLRCVSIDGELPAPFSAALTAVHDLATWEELAWSAIPPQLRNPDQLGWKDWSEAQPLPDAVLPDFPALTPTWWGGLVLDGRCASLGDTLDLAGQMWRNFRLDSESLSARPGQDNRSPEWVSTIRGSDRRYPLAALGLPVGYYSTRSGFKATVEPSRPAGDRTEPLRRASPVWLRPVQLRDGSWRVFTHTFWARVLPDNARLHVTNDGHDKELDVPPPKRAKDTWDRWLAQDCRLPEDFYTGTAT